MGWFNRDNDDDIDDIYNKLEDIYSKLEVLDVVTAFSGRLSRLEKTSAYLENVLMDTVKELEKRVEALEGGQDASTTDRGSELDELSTRVDALRGDVQALKDSMNDSLKYVPDASGVNRRFGDLDEIVKNLNLKVSYLELARDRNSSKDDVRALREELSRKDEELQQLSKKLESLSYLLEEDNHNIKMVAKHIVNQANSMKELREEVYYLSKDRDASKSTQ